jgi:hypothetical protein
VLQGVEEYCQRRGLRVPAGLTDAATTGLLASVGDLTVLHDDARRADTLEAALAAMGAGFFEEPRNLLPVAVVDEGSIACVVCSTGSENAGNPVVRWFLSDVDPRYQGALLDVDVYEYLESLDHEMAARPDGLRRILDEIGPAYEESYLAKDKRPRASPASTGGPATAKTPRASRTRGASGATRCRRG